jgi:hypothetical protein
MVASVEFDALEFERERLTAGEEALTSAKVNSEDDAVAVEIDNNEADEEEDEEEEEAKKTGTRCEGENKDGGR